MTKERCHRDFASKVSRGQLPLLIKYALSMLSQFDITESIRITGIITVNPSVSKTFKQSFNDGPRNSSANESLVELLELFQLGLLTSLYQYQVPQIIDAYMALLLKGRDELLYIDSVNGRDIFEGRPEKALNVLKCKIFRYKCCLATINEGYHWVLMIILPKEKELIYINSIEELKEKQERYLHFWNQFLQMRHANGTDIEPPSGWRITTKEHTTQVDNTSCGVFTLMFAENYISGKKLFLPSENLKLFRQQKGKKIIKCAEVHPSMLKSHASVHDAS
ncbi:uncharacterized protein LOC127831404 [Dreissena polymorpha]|uniref:uncharacterized protein LOC127831404 n=1 Tax=Dreissena polymorpha TaxID=45954 RepID=UPI0022652F2B|nr:uncharacterized protein LOC127831404 [Dreissena polymorpha]